MESLPSEKAQLNNSVVFTSIENRNDIMDELTQNIRPSLMDANTKRYSVPKNYKNSFYAIHHIPRIESPTAENTEPTPLTPPPPPPATTTTTTTTTSKQKKMTTTTTTTTTNTAMSPTTRNRKRITTEPVKNCKRSRSLNKGRKSSSNSTYQETNNNNNNYPQLYQTCHSIWPENQTLGEYSYDNIKSLSNLLKVRLCQAKFKMMAKLDSDNELFAFLADEYVTPNHKLPCSIKLNHKRHKSSLSVVGNGKNLFRRKAVHDVSHLNSVDIATPMITTASIASTIIGTTTTTPTATTATAAETETAVITKKKKKMNRNPPTTVVKTTRRSKKRSAAADIPAVTLSDGSTVYVCEPCHKKYKNRNGLGYHLQRCKYRMKEEGSNNSEESVINCICTQNTDEHGTMVQCDKCQVWLHSECVGLTEEALDDLFYCGKCKGSSKEQQQQQQQQSTSITTEETMSSQEQINHHLHEIFCQTPTEDGEEGEEEDEDVFSMAIDDNSEALHVWDDFSFSSTLEKSNNEPWNLMEEDYENEHPSSSWTINDIGMFGQPPSLLFSDPMSSTLDDVTTPVALSESTPTNNNQDSITTPLPLTETTPNSNCEASSVCDATTPAMNSHTPIHTADGLWFQFANFDDDYQCET